MGALFNMPDEYLQGFFKSGRGHVAVHETGIHGGPPVRVVAIAAFMASGGAAIRGSTCSSRATSSIHSCSTA